MKNVFAIVTLSSILAACAVAPTQLPLRLEPRAAPAAGTGTPNGQEQDDTAAATDCAEELEAKLLAEVEACLPKVELTSSMLYKLLKAELAVPQGRPVAGAVRDDDVARHS